MAIATDQQVQTYVNERLRVRAEQYHLDKVRGVFVAGAN